MRFLRFIVRSSPLVFTGVVLGLLARFILGAPENTSLNERKFNEPVPEIIGDPQRLLDEQVYPVSDFDL